MRTILPAALSLASALIISPIMALAAPVTVTNVLTTEKAWDGSQLPGYSTSQPQLLMNHFKIEPAGTTSVHLHPANGAGYILSGELTMYSTSDPNGSFDDSSKVKTVTLKAGDSWAESVNVWHYGVNNTEEDVTFVVAFASEKGSPATMSLVKQFVD